MKKKIFTLVAAALSILCAQAAENLSLNVAETVSFSGWGFNNENAPTITISNWASGGWEFTTPLSQSDYSGVDISLEPTTENHVNLVIKYVGDAEQTVNVPTGSTKVRADFILEGDITRIGFSYGDWEGGPAEANLPITSALVVSDGDGEVIDLPFADIAAGDDCIKDDETQSLTLTRYSSYPCWVFDPALVSDEYEKMVVTFADPITEDGLEIKAESENDEFSGTTITGMTKGSTKVVAYFSNKPGVNIKSIGFFYGWNDKQGVDDNVTIKVVKAELIKKADSGDTAVDNINVSSDMQESVIYNLYGQRVYNPANGIFIKNGKKIIIR